MKYKIKLMILALGIGGLITSCHSGKVAPAENSVVSGQIIGNNIVQTTVGGDRNVDILFSSKVVVNHFQINNLQKALATDNDWSLSNTFTCKQITPTKPCVLHLRYAPSKLVSKKYLTFDYSYDLPQSIKSSNQSVQSIALQTTSTTTSSGSSTISYSSTTGSNVNANVVPNSAIEELIGLSQTVTITFTPDSSESANNLQVTSGISSINTVNPGWSAPSSFSCSEVKSSNCTLTLSYAPTATTESGTLAIAYTYTNSKTEVVNATISIPYLPLSWGSNYSSSYIQYMTAVTVANQNTDMDGIYPAVESSLNLYLGVDSALGYLGPISQLGPLGPLGPLAGSNTWNYSAWIFDNYTWQDYYDLIYGPLSDAGPLGENGPYASNSYYNGSLFTSNQFAANTRAFGLWSILGPIGPLGAVGALGALGPNGSTGYVTNESGAYINSSGDVVRSISVPYSSTENRTFDLYENYTPAYAMQMPDNDTSFMVVGNLGSNASNNYTINSSQDQIVTALVVPNSTDVTNIMYVGIYTTDNQLIALSNSDLYINYVEFTAPANTSYIVKVTSSTDTISTAYRLYVTGSYSYLNDYYIVGGYINQYLN